MTSRTPAIEIVGLHKSYGDHHVLDGLDLTVDEGTSAPSSAPTEPARPRRVDICSTLLDADAGEVRVAGHDVRRAAEAVRRVIGVTGQFSASTSC